MITIAHTKTGRLLISGHGTAATIAPHDAPALAVAIRRIIAQPASTPALLRDRLARARAKYR